MDKKRTAIVIPTVPGNEQELLQCMESILEYSEDYDYEIFIVKNDYISFSWAVNQALRQILIIDHHEGELPHEGNFRGQSNTPYFHGIFIFNDDMVITNPLWLKNLYEVQQVENADLVVSEDLHRNIGTDNEMCAMGFALFKPEVFTKIGLFDEQFKIGEWDDVDMSVRMIDAGMKLAHTNNKGWSHIKGGSRAFGKLKDKSEIYANKTRFKEKYKGTKWEGRFL